MDFKTLHLVDPELQPILNKFTGFEISNDALEALRSLPVPEPAETTKVSEVFIPRLKQDEPLRLLIIDPLSKQDNGPAVLYLHGGGFVMGSPETILPTAQKLAADIGCVIILPAYRLAPEFPFPHALRDNERALEWIFENAQKLNVDPSRVAICGDSAGGGHAVVLANSVVKRQDIEISFLCLIYPMLDDQTGLDTSLEEVSGEFIWTVENNRYGWRAYIGDNHADVLECGIPARIKNFENFPPVFIATGSLDLFVRENQEFAARCKEQGIPVELHVFPGAYHGFNVIVPDAQISQKFHQTCVAAFKQNFENTT